MHWQYRTMLFEFRKDGILGDKYIDDEEVENLLNEQGQLGWELVNVTPVQEGLLAFLKKQAGAGVPRQEVDHPADAGDLQERERIAGRAFVRVENQELVTRSDKKKAARGEGDLIGGIKIS